VAFIFTEDHKEAVIHPTLVPYVSCQSVVSAVLVRRLILFDRFLSYSSINWIVILNICFIISLAYIRSMWRSNHIE
jgi:hypothetical protein